MSAGADVPQQPKEDGERLMPWDPMNALPEWRCRLWMILACLVCLLQGPAFVRSLRPPDSIGIDFFQEWASARNLLRGLPAYANQRAAINRYLGDPLDSGKAPEVEVYFDVNAHPPT